jgi:hypothetical protein
VNIDIMPLATGTILIDRATFILQFNSQFVKGIISGYDSSSKMLDQARTNYIHAAAYVMTGNP